MSIIRIKPDGNNVYAAPFKRNADVESIVFGRKGEFSPASDIYFEKHIMKLHKIAHQPHISKLHDVKIKIIHSIEKLWYGR